MDSPRGNVLNQTNFTPRNWPGCGSVKNYSCSTPIIKNISATTETSFNNSYLNSHQEKFISIGMTEFILELLGLSAVSASGLVLNLLIVYIVKKHPTSSCAVSILIINLTVTDLISCIAVIPFTIYGITVETWTHSSLLCMMVHALVSITYFVSFWGHLGLAVCRFCLFNFKSKVSKFLLKQSSIVSAVICMWLLTISLHWALLWTENPMAHVRFLPEYGVCGIVTADSEGYMVVAIVLTVMVLGPFVLCIILYLAIAYLARHQLHSFPSQLAKHRFVQMSKYTGLLFGFFCLSWLPDYTRLIIDVDGQAPVWLIRLAYFLYYLNCVVNPYIYALRCDPVRKAFVQWFPRLAVVLRLKSNQVALLAPVNEPQVSQPENSHNPLIPRSAIVTVSSQVPRFLFPSAHHH